MGFNHFMTVQVDMRSSPAGFAPKNHAMTELKRTNMNSERNDVTEFTMIFLRFLSWGGILGNLHPKSVQGYPLANVFNKTLERSTVFGRLTSFRLGH